MERTVWSGNETSIGVRTARASGGVQTPAARHEHKMAKIGRLREKRMDGLFRLSGVSACSGRMMADKIGLRKFLSSELDRPRERIECFGAK